VISFESPELDIYRIMDAMAERKWSLNGLQRPPALHLCVTLRHTRPGVAERFLADLRAAVAEVKANPHKEGGAAPIYGMANTLPDRGIIADLLRKYMDNWYRLE